ncbi:type III-A CRISPR-associated RAMP protein Csm4 [Argonema galeatum]|uniref:type III-A CRISPR-associated RAMP protein Csm4 n=1 Tax=Argonema galeatum TaxID=2942762 RepID=UPI002011C38A|nr:type III-A CRISPR-associated RAMP protein Csm4 [Argonema galeatum]MCL1465977.1 type III-A CRISPR-associated RAMP protein Csm4 [Argonema galeatum A003/A1]
MKFSRIYCQEREVQMSEWRLIKLKFGRTQAHFGEVGIGIEETGERVRSDTLFSAWISAYARLFEKDAVEELLQQFLDSSTPPVRISSTFIYREEGDRTIYYLPRPLQFPINYPKDNDLEFFKTYKKLNYLPLEVWQRWYQGVGFLGTDREELIAETKGKSNGHLCQAGTFDYKKAFKIGQEPKIAVDRITRATNLYHTGFVQFLWEQNSDDINSLSGLYFLLHFSESDRHLEDNLHAALHFLGEEGIGGERSSGAGLFTIEWFQLDKDESWKNAIAFIGGNHHCLISLFWELPLPDGLLNDASYEILERGGWIAGYQLRRKMVRMFAEGSVFPLPPSGKLADVTPGEYKLHPIYRSGISLSLPIKVNEQ